MDCLVTIKEKENSTVGMPKTTVGLATDHSTRQATNSAHNASDVLDQLPKNLPSRTDYKLGMLRAEPDVKTQDHQCEDG